jgi:hypothetical protein
MLRSDDLLRMASIQRLHHLDAEAGAVTEKDRELEQC